MSLRTPVALFIFNRPGLTESVFEAIRWARPEKLLVIADGPRFPEEGEKCERARAVIRNVDWKCLLLTNFSDENLGCGERIKTGLKWAFAHADELIILEDDCLPTQSFFPYCAGLLDRYRNDNRVTSINGSNLGYRVPQERLSYRFTRFMNMWGWATWRRTFETVDFDMGFWERFKHAGEFQAHLGHDRAWIDYWLRMFESVYENKKDFWDYQWILSNLYRDGFVVTPSQNLISNLGWSQHEATRTIYPTHPLARLCASEMTFPLVHPEGLAVDERYEQYIKLMWCGVGVGGGLEKKINFGGLPKGSRD